MLAVCTKTLESVKRDGLAPGKPFQMRSRIGKHHSFNIKKPIESDPVRLYRHLAGGQENQYNWLEIKFV